MRRVVGVCSLALKLPIYLDNNATICDPLAWFRRYCRISPKFGNASRNHAPGWEAEEGRESDQIAALIALPAKKSSSPAADGSNWRSGSAAMYKKGNHIITAITEHKAVLDPASGSNDGFEITFLPVDKYARCTPSTGRSHHPKTILVSPDGGQQ